MNTRHGRYLIRKLTWLILTAFLLCVAVLYSWNSFAQDLFQLPALQFRQAFGIVLFTGCIAFLIRLAFRFAWYEWRE